MEKIMIISGAVMLIVGSGLYVAGYIMLLKARKLLQDTKELCIKELTK